MAERSAKRDILPSTLLGKAIQYALGQWEKSDCSMKMDGGREKGRG